MSRFTARGDDGQVLLLSIAYGVLALALVLVVASASSVHLERKRLLALADHTALAAADALDTDAYYRRGEAVGPDGALLVLTRASVREAAEAHLASSPASGRLREVRLVDAGTTDGRTVHVTLTATARPPLVGWVTSAWSGGVGLEVTSRARAW